MTTIIDGSAGVTFPDATTQAKAGLVAGGTIATGTITTATVGTLNAPSGVLATQNGMTGIAKAWAQFTGATPPVLNGSFNVSSITRNATGYYTINFTTAMSNINYSAVMSGGTVISGLNSSQAIFTNNSALSVAPTTSSFTFFTYGANTNTQTDLPIIGCTVFSS